MFTSHSKTNKTDFSQYCYNSIFKLDLLLICLLQFLTWISILVSFTLTFNDNIQTIAPWICCLQWQLRYAGPTKTMRLSCTQRIDRFDIFGGCYTPQNRGFNYEYVLVDLAILLELSIIVSWKHIKVAALISAAHEANKQWRPSHIPHKFIPWVKGKHGHTLW